MSGGDRYPDCTSRHADLALATLLGAALPAATPMRDFLEALHFGPAPVASDGTGGSQPVWALCTQDIRLTDPVRDGHVPAGCGTGRVWEQAVATHVLSHARSTLLRLTGAVQHALFSCVRGRIATIAPASPEIRGDTPQDRCLWLGSHTLQSAIRSRSTAASSGS